MNKGIQTIWQANTRVFIKYPLFLLQVVTISATQDTNLLECVVRLSP